MNFLQGLSRRTQILLAAAVLAAAVAAFWLFGSSGVGPGGPRGPVISRDGLRVEFAIDPVGAPGEPLKAGEIARLSLKFT
ncbi:MAG: hypothetical protein ACK4MQ_08585, partial [Hyphomonas sp.]